MGSWFSKLPGQVIAQIIVGLVLPGIVAGGLVFWGWLLSWPGPLLALLALFGMGGTLLVINQAISVYGRRRLAISNDPGPDPASSQSLQYLEAKRQLYVMVHYLRILYPGDIPKQVEEFDRMLRINMMPIVRQEEYIAARSLLLEQV